MISLRTHIDSLNFPFQLEVVSALIDQAHPQLSFWGRRTVQVDGFTGAISIDLLARKIIQAGRLRCENDDLTISERLHGLKIVRKMYELYDELDSLTEHHFLGKYLWLSSLLTFDEDSPRYTFEHVGEDLFLGYSRERFLKEFGGKFDEYGQHPDLFGDPFGSPLRVCAKEESVLNKHGSDF